MSAEELEQADIAREGLRELFTEWCKVERVIGESTSLPPVPSPPLLIPRTAMQQPEATEELPQPEPYYLVKWRELPYSECTWETARDIAAFQAEASDTCRVFTLH